MPAYLCRVPFMEKLYQTFTETFQFHQGLELTLFLSRDWYTFQKYFENNSFDTGWPFIRIRSVT